MAEERHNEWRNLQYRKRKEKPVDRQNDAKLQIGRI